MQSQEFEATRVCSIVKHDDGFYVQYPTEFDAHGEWKKESWRTRGFVTEAEAAQFVAEVPNSKADADAKILKAAMDFLEVTAQREDNLDALFHLMGLCENCDVSMVDAIAVEKSVLRHFVKLYGADGWAAYRRFRAKKIARLRLYETHRELVRTGKYDVAALALNFLRRKKITLCLSDAEWETEQVLMDTGFRPYYNEHGGNIVACFNLNRVVS